jgi:hypothetical protein
LAHAADLGILRTQDVFGELPDFGALSTRLRNPRHRERAFVMRDHHIDELLIEGD